MIERDKNTYNLTLPWLTSLELITIKIIINETHNIVAWNANGMQMESMGGSATWMILDRNTT